MVAVKKVVDGLHWISLGKVNVYLLEDKAGDILIDAGYPGDAPKIVSALASIGKKPSDIAHIIVTHAHPDHIGSLAAFQRESGAAVHVHSADRAVVEGNAPLPKMTQTPGFVSWMICKLIGTEPPPLEATPVSGELFDGQILPFAGGVEVIHMPGHSAGQVALLLPRNGGVLIAADAAMNLMGLRLAPLCEDLSETIRSLGKISGRDFSIAVFGHGAPLHQNAATSFRAKWRQER